MHRAPTVSHRQTESGRTHWEGTGIASPFRKGLVAKERKRSLPDETFPFHLRLRVILKFLERFSQLEELGAWSCQVWTLRLLAVQSEGAVLAGHDVDLVCCLQDRPTTFKEVMGDLTHEVGPLGTWVRVHGRHSIAAAFIGSVVTKPRHVAITVELPEPWVQNLEALVDPDLDKLARAALDALGEAGVWHDDAQVVWVRAQNGRGEAPGVRIVVMRPAAGRAMASEGTE